VTAYSLRIPSSTRPFSGLTDNYGRQITYLRLAITDRCNLRCRYCRSETDMSFTPHEEILRFEELERLVRIFTALGVRKVRVTGGEPFARRGCLDFLRRLRKIEKLQNLHITTNGVKIARYMSDLREIGIDGINLSLDTLDPHRFQEITRRDHLDAVLATLREALTHKIPLKINCVVLASTSDQEILALATLAKTHPLTLRFIEPMPFSGGNSNRLLEKGRLLGRLEAILPAMAEEIYDQPTTARTFRLPGYIGKVGVIAGYSRHFCQTCNKVRVTPTGMLKNCLYDGGALDLKKLLRRGATDEEIAAAIISCTRNRFADGYEADRFSPKTREPSMAMIGG
jgi:cyclic pyranopterin phosphate synthase